MNDIKVGYGRSDPVFGGPVAIGERRADPRPDELYCLPPGLSVLAEPFRLQVSGDPTLVKRQQKYRRFLPIAQAIALMSKDTSTKVGAVVLGPDFEIRSTGWNGAPRGSRADEDERTERPEKYQWVTHAEMNAIAQAARVGTPLLGCSMVVTHAPCMICARLIVQAGIQAVYTPQPTPEFSERWGEDLARSMRLFAECGVRLVEID